MLGKTLLQSEDPLTVILQSVLINQFVPRTFCLCFACTDVNFRGMLHVQPMTKTCVDQSELVNVGAEID